MKEPWFNNIAWPKYLGFIANVAMIIGLLETAPIPEKYRAWARFASFFGTSSIAFLLNPKDKPWVEDEAQGFGPVPTPVAWPKEPPTPAATLTNEQMALIAQMLQKGQGQ
jgi:hypothetical protein